MPDHDLHRSAPFRDRAEYRVEQQQCSEQRNAPFQEHGHAVRLLAREMADCSECSASVHAAHRESAHQAVERRLARRIAANKPKLGKLGKLGGSTKRERARRNCDRKSRVVA